MGRSSTSLRGPLPAPAVRCDDPALTHFAGAVGLIRFAESALELPSRIREAVGTAHDARRVFPVHRVLFGFVICALLGVWRLDHVDWLRGDPLVLKLLRLPRWPVRKVWSVALALVDDAAVAALRHLVTALGFFDATEATEGVIDIDTTAIVSFGAHEGTMFGYCGKGRNRRRHNPIVASWSETRTVINGLYRDGRNLEKDECVAFIDDTIDRARKAATKLKSLLFRADGGFWMPAVADKLIERNVGFVLAYPMKAGLKLMLRTVEFTSPFEDDELQFATLSGKNLGLRPELRVVVLRRPVHDPKAPPPGKVVEGEPRYRFQALVTDRDWLPEDVWRFYNQRGEAELIFKEEKHGIGLGCLVSQDFRANEAAFLLRLIAYNLDRLYQADAERRAEAEGRKVVRMGLIARQVRFFWSPGRLLREGGQWVLRTQANARLERVWRFFEPSLLDSA